MSIKISISLRNLDAAYLQNGKKEMDGLNNYGQTQI